MFRDGGSRARDAASLVRSVYAAVNAMIATGDDGALDDLLARDFIDHAPRPGRSPDRMGLLATVRSLHAIAPTRRLVVLDLVAADDRVATRIEGILPHPAPGRGRVAACPEGGDDGAMDIRTGGG